MGRVRAEYDEDELIIDIAEGALSYREIAAKHGISERYVSYLAHGARRPELQPRIAAIAQAIRRQSRRLGAKLTRVAWARLGHLAGAKEGIPDEIQRKAAVDILKIVQADDETDPPEAAVSHGPDLSALSDETKTKVLAELGGPTD